MSRQTHPLTIGSLHRELPLFQVAPGLRIAVLNILGDAELAEEAAQVLAGRLAGLDAEVLVTAEAKSIPLAHALSLRLRRPAVILRKQYKPYMGDALEARTESITTGREQRLFLDQKDRDLLADRRVLLLDDVISSGSTLAAMRRLVTDAGGRVCGVAAICTEGEEKRHAGVIALAHLPLFADACPE